MRHLSILLLLCALGACATKKEATAPPSPAAQKTAPQQKPPPKEEPKPKKNLLASMTAPLAKLLPRKQKTPSALPPRLIGRITSVNQENRFVLIDGVTMQGAQPGDTLICISNQQITSSLRMSALKSTPFLIADILSGTPAPGERVYLQ